MFKTKNILMILCFIGGIFANITASNSETSVQLGPRPFYLLNDMDDGPLKEKLQACAVDYKATRSQFSISHRGAPLQFPEHTKEGYQAAGLMGAGIIECDVTFTKDNELVCRHSQCDLATTTDILARPELAAKCTAPFSAGSGAKCCTSDLTLAEYMSLNGKMDAANKKAKTPASYMNATAKWRTDLYATKATLVTHKQSIDIIGKAGAKYIPELKSPSVKMPFEGSFSQSDFIEKLVEEYNTAGIAASDVYVQSFDLKDVIYLIKNHPDFGKQATWIDGRNRSSGFNPDNAATFSPSMEDLYKQGVRIISPPMWVLVTTDSNGKLVPSAYAKSAKKAGLEIVTWTLERSGPLNNGGGWYYKSSGSAIDNDGDMYTMLDVLAKQVGIKGIFSDWPATVTFYANCMGL
jgi:glycerophosphoryl diester phosphodiesterase